MDKLNFETDNHTSSNVDKIAKLFPEAITEAGNKKGELKRIIDWDKLKLLCGQECTDEHEFYQFTWAGKRNAIRKAVESTTKTLRPCPEESKNWDTTQNLYIEGDMEEAKK